MPAEHGQHARQSEHDARGTADRQVAIRQVVLWRRLDLHDGYSIRDETNRGLPFDLRHHVLTIDTVSYLSRSLRGIRWIGRRIGEFWLVR